MRGGRLGRSEGAEVGDSRMAALWGLRDASPPPASLGVNLSSATPIDRIETSTRAKPRPGHQGGHEADIARIVATSATIRAPSPRSCAPRALWGGAQERGWTGRVAAAMRERKRGRTMTPQTHSTDTPHTDAARGAAARHDAGEARRSERKATPLPPCRPEGRLYE